MAQQGPDPLAPVLTAIHNDDMEALRLALIKNPQAMTLADKGKKNTPLHFAAFRGRSRAAAMLLERGAPVNSENLDGNTPLSYAAWWGDEPTTRIIIERGGRINHRNHLGETPLHLAVRGAKIETVKLLLKCGADVGIKDNEGNTPLAVARKNKYKAIQELLVKASPPKPPSKKGAKEKKKANVN